jgi:hypothetical protein
LILTLIFLNNTSAELSHLKHRTNFAKLDIIIKKRYKTRPYSENKHIKGKDLIMSKLDTEQVIAAFTEAYTAANGKAPAIEAKGGWYSVDGGKNMRLADLEAMTAELGSSSPAKKTKAAAKPKKAAVEKPAAEKKSVAEKKPAAAKKAPAKKKAKKSGFSVKGFWAEKIVEQNSGSKLPR